jgi:capsular polysaccharide biosynthesis protein
MGFRPGRPTRQKQWRLVGATALLGVAVAAVVSMAATPMYTATTTSFIAVNGGRDSDVNSAYTGSLFAQQRVTSYMDVVPSDAVMSGVIDDLGLPMSPRALAEKIEVNNPDDTVTLEISATDPNPSLAQSIANATAEQLERVVSDLEFPADNGEPLVRVTVTQPAALPTSPSSPRTLLNLAIGLVLGLAAGGVAALAWGRSGPRPDATVGAVPSSDPGADPESSV